MLLVFGVQNLNRLSGQKVMSSQSQKSRKAKSPFLSDRVTNIIVVGSRMHIINNITLKLIA